MKKKWWQESVIYQIYPRSFMDSNGDGIGDLKGVTQKLDYLKDLGIDVIWLSPVYKSPNDDNGYDISDYQEIMTEFGSMADFDCLLEEAHKRGLKIIMDLVVNHTSDEHQWFKESCKSKDNPYRDFYIWKEGNGDMPPNSWASFFEGSAWAHHEETDMYYLHLFSKKQPDLNWDNRVVRQKIYEMMQWWLDKGIDGFRMDVINFISKTPGFPNGKKIEGTPYTEKEPFIVCGPHFHEYLKEMNREVLSKYDIMTVGETPSISVEEAQKTTDVNANELNMVFQFEHMDIENEGNSKWSDRRFELIELKHILSKWQYGLNDVGWNSLYWNNHDHPRVVSRFGDDKQYWKASAQMLATCLHMLKGTPYIYQGEEIGMTNVTLDHIDAYKDIETLNAYKRYTEELGFTNEKMMRCIYNRSRDNARTPMQWNAQPNAGFSTGSPWFDVNKNYKEINVESQLEDKKSIFHYYKKLIQLRKSNEVIVYGDYKLLMPDDTNLFVYMRSLKNQKLLVICNFKGESVDFTVPEDEKFHGEPKCLISNYGDVDFDVQLKLKPYEALVFLFDEEKKN
ncbi:glycoside hydrolase family 13 protein [Fusibacter ferrireducens]|uniref:Alpha-glucosidase n=1 Tax=Fusibacter ferrireducens TaxID=2785058 RepID=A0ABR9ZPZ7_9FIRM|nr:alpha-glucosidase [Fusibacter ferrireducens]MBF4692537.1 alpha-glucosidase [Fusibacter ferrireducens]